MIRESLSVLNPPPPQTTSKVSAESQQFIDNYVKSVSDKNPNHEAKGRIGAIFFLVLCGFTLIFFGGGGILIFYKSWIAPNPIADK
jgi:hypothetical protein